MLLSKPLSSLLLILAIPLAIAAQEPDKSAPDKSAQDKSADAKPTPEASAPAVTPAPASNYVVNAGTKIPLSMINSVSTKTAAEGDRIYLETVFPILANGKIVIPPGSYVEGTVTEIKRPGRVKGRGELYVRFDSLTLPNGVTRDFRARIGALDGRSTEELDKVEGKVKSEGNKSGDARTVAEGAGAGATIGGLAGVASGHTGMGAGIGAAAGAAAGLVGILVTRGPDAILARGTTLDMVLDRPLGFDASELDFSNANWRHPSNDGAGPLPSKKTQTSGFPGRRYPF
jgi:type IV secretion system protein VirB10